MRIDQNLISLGKTPIAAFNEPLVYLVETIILPVYDVDRIMHVDFLIIGTLSSMNTIMGQE